MAALPWAGNAEADVCSILMKRVVLPNGQVKLDVDLNADNLVQMEKELLLEEYPTLDPSQHVMMVCKPGEKFILLDDQQTVESATEFLAQGAEYELHILPRNCLPETDTPDTSTEQLNVNLKQDNIMGK